jgi:hypothetical protein
MLTTRALRLTLFAVLGLAVVPATSAVAARRAVARPTITSIGPSSVAVGDTLTIRGRGFLPGRRRDSVSFTRAGGRPVTVKATDATRTRIRVVVPAGLARYLGDAAPTRFRVRVRARRYSRASTALTRSILVRPLEHALGEQAADGCTSGDITDPLDDALGTGLGDTLDTLLPDDGCDAATAGDDPAADDAGDPGDDSAGTDPGDEPVADDTTSG